MIEQLLEKGIVSKKKLLLEYYKKINLTDNQLLIVLMIMHINDQTRKMVTPTLLSQYMNMNVDDIENELQGLVDNDLIDIKPRYIDFNKLFEKLSNAAASFYKIQDNKEFLDSVDQKLNFKLNEEEKLNILSLTSQDITKKQLLEIVSKNQFADYESLIKEINTFLNSYSLITNELSKFDWLDD
ncbi:DnaD family protein [Mycoplasma yeatsii]|uniref:DnaD family protein n=1 Tax=Mycoplasma yeatsii TaxID=51365 RepID=UPI0005B24419|nr:DnaD family protein [Mycoplasma yeatsii]AJM71861.1 hypothetical protein MYE_01900 [Mycoplasma yeatsii GM274B]